MTGYDSVVILLTMVVFTCLVLCTSISNIGKDALFAMYA